MLGLGSVALWVPRYRAYSLYTIWGLEAKGLDPNPKARQPCRTLAGHRKVSENKGIMGLGIKVLKFRVKGFRLLGVDLEVAPFVWKLAHLFGEPTMCKQKTLDTSQACCIVTCM